MNRSPSDRILEEWDVAARGVVQPAEAPRRRGLVGLAGPGGLVPLLATAVVVAVAVTWLGSRAGVDVGTASPTPTTSEVAVVPGSPSPGPSEVVVVPASPSPAPSEASCETDLRAAITSWEGAAGSRIATVNLTNEGSRACVVPQVARPSLVDGSGVGLAIGEWTATGAGVELAPGERATTLVQVSNVCPTTEVVAPVTIQLDFKDGFGLAVKPLTPTDTTVPPCNGPGQPASIEMHPWEPAR